MEHVCNPNTEQPEMAAVSHGTIHITTQKQCCKYSTSVHIQNALYIKYKKNENLQSIIWNHMRQEFSEFARERRTALFGYETDQLQQPGTRVQKLISNQCLLSLLSAKRMYLWWSLCTLYLHAGQVRVTVGDSDLCCWTCVTSFER